MNTRYLLIVGDFFLLALPTEAAKKPKPPTIAQRVAILEAEASLQGPPGPQGPAGPPGPQGPTGPRGPSAFRPVVYHVSLRNDTTILLAVAWMDHLTEIPFKADLFVSLKQEVEVGATPLYCRIYTQASIDDRSHLTPCELILYIDGKRIGAAYGVPSQEDYMGRYTISTQRVLRLEEGKHLVEMRVIPTAWSDWDVPELMPRVLGDIGYDGFRDHTSATFMDVEVS